MAKYKMKFQLVSSTERTPPLKWIWQQVDIGYSNISQNGIR